MERLRVHYWNADDEPMVAVVEAEDAEAAYAELGDVARRGYVESAGPADEAALDTENEE